MKSQGVAVWVALFHDKVIGPFIFDATVNKENYLQMLQDFFVPHLKRLRRYSTTYFQQRWCSTSLGNFLDQSFPERWIGPRSSNLTPLDYFLWGYVKEIVYKDRPQTLDALKLRITETIKNIPKEMLENTFVNFTKRLDECLFVNGGHF